MSLYIVTDTSVNQILYSGKNKKIADEIYNTYRKSIGRATMLETIFQDKTDIYKEVQINANNNK